MRLIAMAAAAGAAGLIGGCDGNRDDRPILKMKVRFAVVIGPGDTVGDPENKGCRLTVEQITEHAQLMTIWMFDHLGEGVHVVPEVLPAETLVDPCAAEFPFIGGGVCGFAPREYPDTEFYQRVLAVDSGYVADAVNIYFTGNVVGSMMGLSVDAHGGTLGDVVCTLPEPFQRRMIFINDGFFDNEIGPGIVRPERITLAHELCHYLVEAAFNSPTYDLSEHPIEENTNNIMRIDLDEGEARPKFLPKPAREEATNRITTGINPDCN